MYRSENELREAFGNGFVDAFLMWVGDESPSIGGVRVYSSAKVQDFRNNGGYRA